MAYKTEENKDCSEHMLTPFELKLALPIMPSHRLFVSKSRQQIIDILDGKDPRKLLIAGPCSIHDIPSALDYAQKLKRLASEVSDKFFVVMRVYFEKPRSIAGWKGMMYDPRLDGSHDIEEGLKMTRKLLIEIASLEVPAGAEFLDPAASCYFGDLISWACVGARTSESQTHRQMASALSMPVAFKNSTSGKIDVAVHGALSASLPHKFIGMGEHGRISIVNSKGNPHAHIVLRGGEGGPNYDPESIGSAIKALQQHQLPLRLLVDCSHDNSNKTHDKQPDVFRSVIKQVCNGESRISGVILESHLFAGSQKIPQDLTQLRYAVSLTDPCLDWTSTEKLVDWGYQELKREDKNGSLKVVSSA